MKLEQKRADYINYTVGINSQYAKRCLSRLMMYHQYNHYQPSYLDVNLSSIMKYIQTDNDEMTPLSRLKSK